MVKPHDGREDGDEREPAVRDAPITVAEADLDDLRRRLAATRWPGRETVPGWTQGMPLDYLRELCDYWRKDYDWRRLEREVNALGPMRTEIEGVGIHFLHVPSPHLEATPLLLTHGWPGSVVEFLDLVGPLTRPTEFGGAAADAFELVIPSLPGFGFSDAAPAGWGTGRIARAWVELMRRLGHARFLAQGGDWGAIVTTRIAELHPQSLLGIHLNMPLVSGREIGAAGEPTPAERSRLDAYAEFARDGQGYAVQQSTRPQTLAYGLTDSPAGQCAWVVEKFREWSDCEGLPEEVFSRDRLLDNVSTYWLFGRAASAARLYWESYHDRDFGEIAVPTGATACPREIYPTSRRWAERRFKHLVYWSEPARGGHFPALERPHEFARELWNFRGALPATDKTL